MEMTPDENDGWKKVKIDGMWRLRFGKRARCYRHESGLVVMALPVAAQETAYRTVFLSYPNGAAPTREVIRMVRDRFFPPEAFVVQVIPAGQEPKSGRVTLFAYDAAGQGSAGEAQAWQRRAWHRLRQKLETILGRPAARDLCPEDMGYPEES